MANQPYGTYDSYVSSRLTADPYSAVRNSEFSKHASYDQRSALYSNPGDLSSYLSGLGNAGLSLGVKRSADALYSQNDLGAHNTIGQNDALLSSNSMFKFPRYESSSQLPLYPQRLGVKDCSHYMLTRTCKFGEACKFDHPMWVPAGGIPNWKEGLATLAVEPPPERPGEPDCPFYMKTGGQCKFGSRCRFNHPRNISVVLPAGDGTQETAPIAIPLHPERPGEPICTFYLKTGNCRFGATCKFHHPKDIQFQPPEQNADGAANFVPFTPALYQNSKGLPVRPGETDCPFYLKTGSCKYSATCRYNHPERSEINPMLAASGLQMGLFNAAANLFPGLAVASVYPQRPGEAECDYYMKTGKCTYADRCKYHHPMDRTSLNMFMAQAQAQPAQGNVKLTLAGLPRREGAVACPFYMKTGMCKFAVTCKFDHPPPEEAVAMAATTTQAEYVADAAAAP